MIALFSLLLVISTLAACSPSSLEANLRPDSMPASTANTQPKKRQGLVVTDNPYMISSDRLEKMNKGGFGAY